MISLCMYYLYPPRIKTTPAVHHCWSFPEPATFTTSHTGLEQSKWDISNKSSWGRGAAVFQWADRIMWDSCSGCLCPRVRSNRMLPGVGFKPTCLLPAAAQIHSSCLICLSQPVSYCGCVHHASWGKPSAGPTARAHLSHTSFVSLWVGFKKKLSGNG